MAPRVMATPMTLLTTEEKVSVKACWAPSTSLLSRRHERPGLGAGEEGDGHLLDVGEHAGAHVEDEAFADAGRHPALPQREHGVEDGQPADDEGEPHDEARRGACRFRCR